MYVKKRERERERERESQGHFTGDEVLARPTMARRRRPNGDGACARRGAGETKRVRLGLGRGF
jgi:hypothetical protein